ncbi:nucleic acid dioxygenase ALKBH1-like [Corticium candelabrum]|uniref:nucleic acid dioxygenase ALKBH1-like n=1 Tax=Corticium candelabrum TaxID=121492 RepID=UPI002E259585|nr:nucleic acid dioxygenase ALKBH1-like [Corticium candelabrum]
MASKTPEMATNEFKLQYKRFRAKKSQFDLTDVIDFSLPHQYSLIEKWKKTFEVSSQRKSVDSETDSRSRAACFGLKSPETWQIYQISSNPGFLYIVNPFSDGSQYYWCQRCVLDYPCLPNVCNLDAHVSRSKQSFWDVHRSIKESGSLLSDSPLMKLHWVTLGYHYDWDKKVYHKDIKSEFPDDLAGLSHFVAETVGFLDFRPEAAIVNFYHMDSAIGGHTDHSEFDLSAPLLSFSFGQEAIFLLGGESLFTKPVAIRVRSGDIMVMSGASRLCYHAVPRIMRNVNCSYGPSAGDSLALPGCSLSCSDGVDSLLLHCSPSGWQGVGQDSQLLIDYMHNSRININVRQVLSTNGTFPSEDV